jgi:hypothetical protein
MKNLKHFLSMFEHDGNHLCLGPHMNARIEFPVCKSLARLRNTQNQ